MTSVSRAGEARVFAVALMLLFATTFARADAESCVAASDEGQKLRDEGHLLRARTELATCAHEDCPALVRGDCVRWVAEVEKRIPTVVLGATSAGKDATDVRVTIDGAVVSTRLDGAPVSLDPGEHRIRYEHAGDPPVEERIVLRDGEKDRPLRVAFGASAVVDLAPRSPTLAYAMTGTAIGSVLAFTALAITGYATIQDCKSNQPACSGASLSSHQSQTTAEFVFADVSLGVAIVAASIATWAFIRHAAHHATPRGAIRFDPGHAAIVF